VLFPHLLFGLESVKKCPDGSLSICALMLAISAWSVGSPVSCLARSSKNISRLSTGMDLLAMRSMESCLSDKLSGGFICLLVSIGCAVAGERFLDSLSKNHHGSIREAMALVSAGQRCRSQDERKYCCRCNRQPAHHPRRLVDTCSTLKFLRQSFCYPMRRSNCCALQAMLSSASCPRCFFSSASRFRRSR